MRIIFATKNRGKVSEAREILDGVELITMTEAGYTEEIIEDGKSFEENALIKARSVCRATGCPCVADDSGLEVYALDMQPGIYSARYAGEGCSDRDRYEKLLEQMKDKSDRRARFVCAAAVCFPDGREFVCRGEAAGEILHAPEGEGGFGYDPVFFHRETGKTFAAMNADEKNKISHRKRAFEKLREIIQG